MKKSLLLTILFSGFSNAQYPIDIFMDRNPELQELNIFKESIGFEDVTCGYKHCYGLKNKTLYVSGYNSKGQLGLGKNKVENEAYKWTMISFPFSIVEIDAYGYYGMFKTEQGDVYSTGSTEGGKLGQLQNTNYYVWSKVIMPEGIDLSIESEVVLTERNSFILDNKNKQILATGLMLKSNGKISSNPSDRSNTFILLDNSKETSDVIKYRVLPEIKRSGGENRFFED